MKKTAYLLSILSLALTLTVSCNRNEDDDEIDEASVLEETYAGGKLGTVFNSSSSAYEQPSPAVEQAGLTTLFKYGEFFFERPMTQSTSPFKGLGPLYFRTSCMACHPGYGHGHRMTRYRADDFGNAYLLVVTDRDGNIVPSVSLVPHTKALPPFKPVIDEDMVQINWREYTDEWGNKFPDGETYSLIYPDVVIPEAAFYVPLSSPYNTLTFTLESTIGLYGTGLLDAIPDDSLKAEYIKQEQMGISLNPAIFANGNWTSVGADGHPFRLDYALDVTSTQGNVSLWEVTNAVSNPFTYNLLPEGYAETAAADPDVQAEFYHYYPNENKTGNVQQDIYNFLANQNIEPEISDDDNYNLILWLRGLAVPAARNLSDPTIQKGRKLFREIGCAYCHRPSWTTGPDNQQMDPNGTFHGTRTFPQYPYQKIWPYTDLVQHKLHMQNDIRTGWCRTTPLWGKGLMGVCTGYADRMHDCRARNVIEAIMWHGNRQSDARFSVEKFRKLSKEDRDAVVKFVNAI